MRAKNTVIWSLVDDTKFVAKNLLDELFRSLDEIFENEYGRKVLSYLLAPRDSRFFIKDYIKRLQQGDSSEMSKKDQEKRHIELVQYSIKHLSEYLDKNLTKMLFNGASGILIPQILNHMGKI